MMDTNRDRTSSTPDGTQEMLGWTYYLYPTSPYVCTNSPPYPSPPLVYVQDPTEPPEYFVLLREMVVDEAERGGSCASRLAICGSVRIRQAYASQEPFSGYCDLTPIPED